MQTLIFLDKVPIQTRIPHHQKADLISETEDLLVSFQSSDNILIGTPPLMLIVSTAFVILGSLCSLILLGLGKMGVNILPKLMSTPLSPSFYQPECLSKVLSFSPSKELTREIPRLLTQLNHFESWIQFPEYDQVCMKYLDACSNKGDVLKMTRHRLQSGDTSGAIYILERFKRESWPDIYRFESS